jgi:hypothetical protein
LRNTVVALALGLSSGICTSLLSGVSAWPAADPVGALVVMPPPQAMVLHAVTQMASNGWRALLWRQHIVWKLTFSNIVGSVLSIGSGRPALRPDKAALLLLGLSPFVVRAIPERHAADLGPARCRWRWSA